MYFYDKVLEQVKNISCIQKERGAIFVLTALLLPIMFGCLGIAYDVGNVYMHKARLQNVTDAAALAGGRAYLDSQKKTTGTKDAIDDDSNGHDSDNPFTYTIAGRSNRSADGITYDNSSRKHAEADKAADDFIYNNIINLGETVHADKFSHYALKGIKKNAPVEGQEDSYTAADEIFYRVGLYETVPLYFLSVITNKNVETVRAGSVVLVQPGRVIPGSGGGTTTIKNPSIFDNLFTYSEYFDSGLANENNKVNATYVGDMVFTYGNGSSSTSVFYNIDKIINNSTQSVDHLFSDDTGASEYLPSMRENPSGTSGGSWAKVNDPIIDTYYKTTTYVSAFETKLNAPHIDVYKTDLSASEINDHNGSLYNQKVVIDGKTVQQKGGVLYVKDGSDSVYYAVDPSSNAYMSIEENGQKYRVYYVRPQNANYVCKCVNVDGKYYLLNENGTRSNCYVSTTEFNNQKMVIEISGDGKHPLRYENGVWQYGVADGGGNFNTWNNVQQEQLRNSSYPAPLINTTFDQNDTAYTAHIDSNVFHFSKALQANVNNVNISITEALNLDTDNPATPIYIIIDNTIDGSINVTCYDNVRPVILVYLGTGNLKLQNGGDNNTVAKLTIYAPYGTVGITPDQEQINYIGTFYGNIIARRIANQASGGPGGKWIQQNLLENNDYTDADVAKATKNVTDNTSLTTLPDDVKADILNTYATSLGKEVSDLTDPLFYSKLGYNDKQTLYSAWKSLQVKYSGYADQLWPWNEHFNKEPGEDQIVDEKLRLINYRTEFQVNEDGSIPENKLLDPFIFETLAKPNTY